MELDLGFLDEKGIDTRLGAEYTGGKDKYLSAIKRYYGNFESNKAKIEKFFNDGDMENYKIQVHALKSNSKMMGALELSSAFEALEHAARDGNTDFVKENHAATVAKYSEFVELLRPIGEADIEKPVDEISGETAKKVVEELLEALDDFDDEKSSELAKTLCGYPFGLKQKKQMEEAINLIAGFSYDDAADIIKEVAETIE